MIHMELCQVWIILYDETYPEQGSTHRLVWAPLGSGTPRTVRGSLFPNILMNSLVNIKEI